VCVLYCFYRWRRHGVVVVDIRAVVVVAWRGGGGGGGGGGMVAAVVSVVVAAVDSGGGCMRWRWVVGPGRRWGRSTGWVFLFYENPFAES
jgi:hypothetical protein